MGGLGATYTVRLRLIGKLVADFLLVLIELFTPGVTAEVRSTLLEIGVFERGWLDSAKFSRSSDVPRESFLQR